MTSASKSISRAAAITPEEMAQYKATARRRWQAEQAARQVRHAQAWEVARQAADLLKRDFGVQRVVAFGSLLYPYRFDERSDVDLAAWGLTSRNWLKAWGAVQNLSREIEVDVVDVNTCSPGLLAVIEAEGVDL